MPQETSPRHSPRLNLLGHWRFSGAPGLPTSGLGSNGRRLLAMLALGGARSRSELGGALWPNVGEATAAARLRTVLWRLAGFRTALLVEGCESIELSPLVWVDVDELFRAAARIEEGLPDGDPRLFEADLLPGWDEDWLVIDRERIRQARLHALERLSDHLLGQSHYGPALDAALGALGGDPLRESAHRAAIRVHLAEGNLGEAIQQFGRCRTLLRDELGLEPSQALADLVKSPVPGPLLSSSG